MQTAEPEGYGGAGQNRKRAWDTMRIKLAILHSDAVYLNRLVSILSAKYHERLALYSFTEQETAMEAVAREKIDVFLADDVFGIPTEELPEKCGFAYFVDSPEVDTFKGAPAICQFQRAELIYKQILGVFSDALGETSVRNLYSGSAKVLIFSSPCGGTGTSSLAAACAVHYANAGKRCVYLNLEDYGSADEYFSGEGAFSISDVIYAVKSRRGSLTVKLESCLKRDPSGVLYFSGPKVALDMMELNAEDRKELVSALVDSGICDCVLVDMPFDLEKETRGIYALAHVLVWVCDGRSVSIRKTDRAFEALRLLEQNGSNMLWERVCLLQNKLSGETAAPVPEGLRKAGGVSRIPGQQGGQLVGQLAASPAFDAILEI